MTSSAQGSDGLVFIDPKTGFEIRPWPPGRDAEAAVILASATSAGTPDAAQEAINEIRAGGDDRLFGGLIDGTLVGAYGLSRDGMANQIAIVAVAQEHRRRGIGRSLLQDALRRSGRRPLVAETDEAGLAFYKACGFKLVGRRKHPSGTFRYRLGWHAPGLRFKGGSTNSLTSQPVKPGDTPKP